MDWLKEEAKHLKGLNKAERLVRNHYKKFFIKLQSMIERGYSERTLLKFVDKEIKRLGIDLTVTLQVATNTAVGLSVSKNSSLIKQYRDNIDVDLKRINEKLSPKIWNLKENLTDPIHKYIKEGYGSKELAKEIVGEVNATSKGQGVYKEPIKNAERVTRNVINTAYRENDALVWDGLDFVIGKEIHLSNSPKSSARCWICTGLTGEYPKEFVWRFWHLNCLCYQTPILLSDEDYDKWERGELEKLPLIKMNPKKVDWVNQNSYRWAGWKSQPEWIVNF